MRVEVVLLLLGCCFVVRAWLEASPRGADAVFCRCLLIENGATTDLRLDIEK